MESKELLHPEDVENQNQEVNSDASQEGQISMQNEEQPEPEMQTSAEKLNIVEIEPENPIVEPESVLQEPIAVEPEPQPEPVEVKQEEFIEPSVAEVTPAPAAILHETVENMMADIEHHQSLEEPAAEEDEEIDADNKEVEESIENIEAEYAAFSFEEAVTAIENVVRDTDHNKIKLRVGVLKSNILKILKAEKQQQLEKFIEEGGVKEEFVAEISELERRFNHALHVFKDNKVKFLEEVDKQKQKNLEAKQAIIEGLKNLVETESNLKVLNDNFKSFQEQWKEIGPVSANESGNLWNTYHYYVDKFFDILKINRELRSLDLKKNLELKINICERAESLLLQDSINKSFKELQQLHDEWKEVGPVSDDKKEEIWERFKMATNQINSNRRAYYDKIYSEQQTNYNAKLVICNQAEELVNEEISSIKKFNEVSAKLAELLNVWKTVGPAPSKLNEEIWNKFKGTLDRFFQNKKEYFSTLKDGQMQNYHLKRDLVSRANSYTTRTDWKQASEELIAIQKEWKEIGAVPRKYADTLWQEFRGACDKFFAAKSTYFANAKEIEAENLIKRRELIQKITEHQFGDDKNENLEALKLYQREWTEIGFVPRKEKDKVYEDYRNALNARFGELKVAPYEMRRNSYHNKLSNILNNPNAENFIDKESRFISNKVKQLKTDIALWENNLGFFVHSKNADVLKAEFVCKIDAAKEELKELEFKIRTMKTEQKAKEKQDAADAQAAEKAKENETSTPESENN